MAGVKVGDIEIKIITTDHQTYKIRTEKDVAVPAIKEQIAQVTGVVSGHHQLLCGGRFLKDDENLSAYNLEDGHTLHLVVRKLVDPLPESSESPVSDPFLTAMQAFDCMMEDYRADFNVGNRSRVPVGCELHLNTHNLQEDVESLKHDRIDYFERVRVLEHAREILFGLMLRRAASHGPQLSRLRTGLVLVQDLLHDARLSLRAVESGFKSTVEALEMSKMLDQIISENGGPENNNSSSRWSVRNW